MDRDVLLFNHTHTPDSNRFEEEVRGLRIATHATDYVAVVRTLPEGQGAIFVKTDHWKTDPAYFDRLEAKVETAGGSFERFETYVCFRLDGSTGAVINGVESSLRRETYHVTICGVPLSDESVYRNLDLDQLLDVGARAEWIAPAHIGMPMHRYPRALLKEVFERAERSGVTVALGYPTGYCPLYNRLSRNEIPFRQSVTAYADQYGIPLVPELDLHGTVPSGFSGCGVLDSAVLSDIEEGVLPTETILDSDVLRPPECHPGVARREFLRDYAAFVPMLSEPADPGQRFRRSLPETAWLRTLDVRRHSIPLP